MSNPVYVDLIEARAILASIGVALSERQMKRAADKDAQGRRKLPFFVDPITGKLTIEKAALLQAYVERQAEAKANVISAQSNSADSAGEHGGVI